MSVYTIYIVYIYTLYMSVYTIYIHYIYIYYIYICEFTQHKPPGMPSDFYSFIATIWPRPCSSSVMRWKRRHWSWRTISRISSWFWSSPGGAVSSQHGPPKIGNIVNYRYGRLFSDSHIYIYNIIYFL